MSRSCRIRSRPASAFECAGVIVYTVVNMDAGGNASEQTAHRLRRHPEERMLLFITYVRSLHIGDIVKYIMAEPLPVRRGIQEYDHLALQQCTLL